MRVAIAHDYLTQRGGAERVVLAMARAFPEAPIYTTLFDPDATYPEFSALDVRPSPINRLQPLRRNHRIALPFLAREANRVSIDADVVVASSSGWAHGFATTGKTLVYCHSPARWLYQTETYLGARVLNPASVALMALRPYLRAWDRRAADRADQYLANSTVVRDRIRECYGREADVLPAPVMINAGHATEELLPSESGYFLCVSRLLPYKNVRKIVAAFRGRKDKLVIVGNGPLYDEIVSTAPPNVTVHRDVTDEELRNLYRGCAAVIAASYEDFGLTPVEGATFGKPTIALRWGGFLDTIDEGRTGTFFDEPNPLEISSAVDKHLAKTWDEAAIETWAHQFSEQTFRTRLHGYVDGLAANNVRVNAA